MLLFSMVSTKFDHELLHHFVPYYVGIGIDPHNIYMVLHSEGGIQADIDETLRVSGNYPINYNEFTGQYFADTKFTLLVRNSSYF